MHEFDASLVRLPGKIAWTVFYIPNAFTEKINTKSRINVKLIVDGKAFQGTLLPGSNGHYQVYNQAMREHCRKEIGEVLHVLIEEDNLPRELEIPVDIAKVLSDSKSATENFSALPYYIRREEINKIVSAKTPATREKRINALVDKLLK